MLDYDRDSVHCLRASIKDSEKVRRHLPAVMALRTSAIAGRRARAEGHRATVVDRRQLVLRALHAHRERARERERRHEEAHRFLELSS